MVAQPAAWEQPDLAARTLKTHGTLAHTTMLVARAAAAAAATAGRKRHCTREYGYIHVCGLAC